MLVIAASVRNNGDGFQNYVYIEEILAAKDGHVRKMKERNAKMY
jgi:hypothetical protein